MRRAQVLKRKICSYIYEVRYTCRVVTMLVYVLACARLVSAAKVAHDFKPHSTHFFKVPIRTC